MTPEHTEIPPPCVTITDRPVMLSDLFLFIRVASEAAREQQQPFEDMLAAVVMDELEAA